MKYLLFLVLLSGCAYPGKDQLAEQGVYYKRDMRIEVNGFQSEGVLVAPKAGKYKIEIKAKGELDLFTLTTCHREHTEEDAGEGGIFGSKKKVKYKYIPSKGIEDTESCPVQLGGYEKDKGRHSWGFIDFQDDAHTLPALVSCNGNQYNSSGVSVCQSKAGLLQRIEFTKPVLFDPTNNCAPLQTKDNKVFEYEIGKGECLYLFMERDGDGKLHRHTTVGYERILIRD